MPADILIYAIVAAGLVFWLRNILGTRTGNERERPNPFTSQNEQPPERAVRSSRAPDAVPGVAPGLLPDDTASLGAGLDRSMSIENPAAERGLMEIVRADRSFELHHFLAGAQDAFILIIEAFAQGDKETLENLLSPSVYAAFQKVIDERAAKGEKGSVEIHAIRKSEVMDAGIRDKTVFVTVRFTADETSIVRDKDGHVIFGNPERVTETIDIWTFVRPLRAARDAWRVAETREDAADEVSGSTVPGAD